MNFSVEVTKIPEVIKIQTKVFKDNRGFFIERFNSEIFNQLTGVSCHFVQDNFSRSKKGVLRGLHYQITQPQGKLINVVRGEIYDVAVDIRRGSKTFGNWVGANLSEGNCTQLWIPPGFAHGFFVMSETADVIYKTTDYYNPQAERSIKWDDPTIGISWPSEASTPILSEKDSDACYWNDADLPSIS